MIIGGITFRLQVVLGLRNVGQVAVRAPFLRLKGVRTALHPEATSIFLAKTRADGEAAYAAGANVILHVDDEVKIATIASGMSFGDLGTSTPADHVSAVAAGQADERFHIGEFSINNHHERHSVPEQSFELEATFGAENVRIERQPPRFFGRKELFWLFRPLVT